MKPEDTCPNPDCCGGVDAATNQTCPNDFHIKPKPRTKPIRVLGFGMASLLLSEAERNKKDT